MSKTMTNWSQWFVEEVARCAREGHAAMMKQPIGARYVWFKTLSLIIVADDTPAPEGYELAFPERVPGNLEVGQLTAWLHQRSSRLPILPSDRIGK